MVAKPYANSQVPAAASTRTSKLHYLYQKQHYLYIQLGSNINSKHLLHTGAIIDI